MTGPGCSTDPRLVGDPVDTLNGALTDSMLDFRLTGRIELRWYRHYDSAWAHRSFSLGNGSAHEYDRVLTRDGDALVYEQAVGRVVRFPAPAHDGETCQLHGFTLLRQSARRFRLASRGMPAMEFAFAGGARRSSLGRLILGASEVCFHYDETGSLSGITDSLGRQIAARSDEEGRLQELSVRPNGGSAGYLLIAYDYDEQGNLVATRNTGGHGYAFRYDGANRMVRRRGRKGFQFHYVYDAQGRCTRSVGDERLHGVALRYLVPGRRTEVIRPDLGRWEYAFSARGDLESIRDPLGGVQKFVRGPGGKLAMTIDANGNATRMVYDAAGTPIARLDPFGRRTKLPETPGAAGPPPPRLAANAAEYEHGWLVDPGRTALPTPMEAAALDLPSDARSLLATAAPSASVGAGEAVRVRPLGARWWPKPHAGRVFSPLGKLVEQHDAFERVRRWTYDASGNLATWRDYDGGVWRYEYGKWHLLRGVTDPLGAETQLSYTPSAKVASALDGGGSRSDYRYDLCDRLVEVVRHGMVRDRYSRDAAGNLIAKHARDGRELLRVEVGPGNLPVRRTLACGEEHSLRYDASGRLATAATGTGRVEIGYDRLGNRTSETRDGVGITHEFDDRQRRPSVSTYLARFVVKTRWHRGGVSISDPTGAEHDVVLHRHGIVERRFANESREVAQYDDLGRCLGKTVHRPATRAWTRRYRWSGEGELLAVEDNRLGNVRCEYDAAHRLRRRIVGHGTEAYDLDAADNLLAQPGLDGVSLCGGNQLGAANGWRFEYDDRDHLASRSGPDGQVRYSYNSRDQLVLADTPDGILECEYDALGRRVLKRWNGRATWFHWFGNQLIAEQDADDALRLYVYTDSLALTPLLVVDYDSPKAPPESGRCYAVFADQVGTPCRIEDSSGVGVWEARIQPYGRAELTGRPRVRCDLRFPGHYADDEVGLFYNRFRHYDPVLGRYLQSDPWGLGGGWNLYAYRTNPLRDVDVRGLGDEHDPNSPCQADDEEAPPGGIPYSDDGEADRPRLGQQEGQDIVDAIHGAVTDPVAGKNRTTTVTETEDGTIIVSSSSTTTREQRAVIAGMQEPGGPLDGRQVMVPDDPRNPGYIPPADRNLPPQGANGTATGAENHGEQRGIQAANYYDQNGDGNGQGHGPADTQWSKSDAGHQGQACPHCAAAQRANNVSNPTGVDPDP